MTTKIPFGQLQRNRHCTNARSSADQCLMTSTLNSKTSRTSEQGKPHSVLTGPQSEFDPHISKIELRPLFSLLRPVLRFRIANVELKLKCKHPPHVNKSGSRFKIDLRSVNRNIYLPIAVATKIASGPKTPNWAVIGSKIALTTWHLCCDLLIVFRIRSPSQNGSRVVSTLTLTVKSNFAILYRNTGRKSIFGVVIRLKKLGLPQLSAQWSLPVVTPNGHSQWSFPVVTPSGPSLAPKLPLRPGTCVAIY